MTITKITNEIKIEGKIMISQINPAEVSLGSLVITLVVVGLSWGCWCFFFFYLMKKFYKNQFCFK